MYFDNFFIPPRSRYVAYPWNFASRKLKWDNAAYLHPYDASVVGYKDLASGRINWVNPYDTSKSRQGDALDAYALRVSEDDPVSLQRAKALDNARKAEEHLRNLDQQLYVNKMQKNPLLISGGMSGFFTGMRLKQLPGILERAADAYKAGDWLAPLGSIGFGVGLPMLSAGFIASRLYKNVRDKYRLKKMRKKLLKEAEEQRRIAGVNTGYGQEAYKSWKGGAGLFADDPRQYLNYRPGSELNSMLKPAWMTAVQSGSGQQ